MNRTRFTQLTPVLALLLPFLVVRGDTRKKCLDGATTAENSCFAADQSTYSDQITRAVNNCADCVSLNSTRPGGNTVNGTGSRRVLCPGRREVRHERRDRPLCQCRRSGVRRAVRDIL